MVVCALALAVTGCGRREAAALGREREAGVAEAPPARSEPIPAARSAPMPAAAPNVPRLPHPPAARLLVFEPAQAVAAEEAAELERAADRFLQERIPDFAIKDAQRPWLDRQYVPEAFRVFRKDDAWHAELRLACHAWDEGEPAPGYPAVIELLWSGRDWRMLSAPDDVLRDLEYADRTLAGDWAPGERMVAAP